MNHAQVFVLARLFGTNGIRGLVNNELTPEMVLNIARAVGTVLGPGKMAVSRDSRCGGMMYTGLVTAGLLSTGCPVVDIGPAPTPALQYYVRVTDCVSAMMVTASHNPPEFNGIKVIGPDGIEVDRDIEQRIEDVYLSRSFKTVAWTGVPSRTYDDTAIRRYIDAIISAVDVEAIRHRGPTVVIDGANSVGSLVTPHLLRKIGCRVYSMNAQMDGLFPGRPPEPTSENIIELSKTVQAVGADMGIAHDGDADRATFVDEKGNVLSGDQSFAIIAARVLAKKRGSTLVTPVSSGRLIEDIARQAGARIEWTRVGSVVVSHTIVELNAELGGEENGGVFYPRHQPVRDGAMTAAKMAEILSVENRRLSEIVSALPTYYTKKIKIPVPREKNAQVLQRLIDMTKDITKITLDGIKLIYDKGWILIRPSGTEPLWRIFAEGTTQHDAEELCKMGETLVDRALS